MIKKREQFLMCLILTVIYFILNITVGDSGTNGYTKKYFFSSYFLLEIVISFLFIGLFFKVAMIYNKWLLHFLLKKRKNVYYVFLYVTLLFLFNHIFITFYEQIITVLVSKLFPALLPQSELNCVMSYKDLYISLILVSFVTIGYLNIHYIQLIVNMEKEKKKLQIEQLKTKEIAMQAQLKSLKMQLDPHFMFNNYSILSSLIYEDQAQAGQFLNHLSKVYRYVIQNSAKDTLTIAEELKFLESYLYLIKIRFGDNVKINIAPEVMKKQGELFPMSLQLVVENAIKHNSATKENPLMIDIYLEENRIVVSNNLNKLISQLHSTQTGHQNIVDRYCFFKKEIPKVVCTDKYYKVTLPILT